MLRRIDRWIGQRMNAKRWIWVYGMVALIGATEVGRGAGWGAGQWCGVAMVSFGAFMVSSHLGRLR